MFFFKGGIITSLGMGWQCFRPSTPSHPYRSHLLNDTLLLKHSSVGALITLLFSSTTPPSPEVFFLPSFTPILKALEAGKPLPRGHQCTL